MNPAAAHDLDYLAARAHARRSRVADGGRLDALCRLGGVDELVRAVRPRDAPLSASGFQRRLLENLAAELEGFLPHLAGAGGRLFAWISVRFQVENIKVLLRGILTATPLDSLRPHLLRLPARLEVDASALASAGSVQAFAERLQAGPLRRRMREAAAVRRDRPSPFFCESALDRAYLERLLELAAALPAADRELVAPLARQEADTFHLMLAGRGRFLHGLTPDELLPFHVAGAGIGRTRFAAMLADADVGAACARVAGVAVDAVPTLRGDAAADAAAVEAAAWARFLRLARRAFRGSHMGFAALVGYAAIRRLEAANLITLSEGLRAGADGASLRARMIPRAATETVHV